jgi:hypothetical protein
LYFYILNSKKIQWYFNYFLINFKNSEEKLNKIIEENKNTIEGLEKKLENLKEINDYNLYKDLEEKIKLQDEIKKLSVINEEISEKNLEIEN